MVNPCSAAVVAVTVPPAQVSADSGDVVSTRSPNTVPGPISQR